MNYACLKRGSIYRINLKFYEVGQKNKFMSRPAAKAVISCRMAQPNLRLYLVLVVLTLEVEF